MYDRVQITINTMTKMYVVTKQATKTTTATNQLNPMTSATRPTEQESPTSTKNQKKLWKILQTLRE